MNSPMTDKIYEFMKGLDVPIRCDELAIYLGTTPSKIAAAMGRLVDGGKVENKSPKGKLGEYVVTKPNKIATIRMREWKPLVLPRANVHRPVIDAPGMIVTRRLTGERL